MVFAAAAFGNGVESGGGGGGAAAVREDDSRLSSGVPAAVEAREEGTAGGDGTVGERQSVGEAAGVIPERCNTSEKGTGPFLGLNFDDTELAVVLLLLLPPPPRLSIGAGVTVLGLAYGVAPPPSIALGRLALLLILEKTRELRTCVVMVCGCVFPSF